MRNFNNKISKTFGLLVLCCLVSFSVMAQTKGHIVGTSTMPVSWSYSNTPTPTSFSYQITGMAHKCHGYTWSVAGDLMITGMSSDSTAVSVISLSTNSAYRPKDFGKGRVRVSYWEDTISSVCGNPIVSCDVYKQFQDTITKIIGPDCITQGDTVTFSIDAMVSVNLNANIGMDHYYWDFSIGLVDHILYYSGDSSSVTFVAGSLTGHDTIYVDMGQCNLTDGFRYSKTLGQAVKTPTFVTGFEPPTCLPFNVSLDTIIISSPQSNVKYSWDFGSWTVKYTSTHGDTVIFVPATNAQTITLTATGPCETQEYKYTVTRALTSINAITAGKNPTCQSANTRVQFGVSGVPDGTVMNWTVKGTGWSINASDTMNTSPYITTGTDTGFVSVRTASCPYTITDTIFIKPATPGAITGDACLTIGDVTSKTYSVASIAHANSYEWKYPSGWTVSGDSTSTSITLIPNGTSADSIKVRAVGCSNSAWRSELLSLYGVKPTGFTASKTCLNSGMTDQITYTVTGTSSGQTYGWSIPSSFGTITSSNADSSVIVVTTLGTANTYQILVRAKTNCGATDWDTTSVTVSGEPFTVTEYDNGNSTSYYELTPTGWTSRNHTFLWMLDGVNITYTSDNMETRDTIQGLTSSTSTHNFYAIVTSTSTGCKTKQSYGVSGNMKSASVSSQSLRSANVSNVVMNVSPNPATSTVTVSLSGTGKVNIRVTDASGRVMKVFNNQSETTEIGISDLPTGAYIILAVQNEKMYRKTIIKK